MIIAAEAPYAEPLLSLSLEKFRMRTPVMVITAEVLCAELLYWFLQPDENRVLKPYIHSSRRNRMPKPDT